MTIIKTIGADNGHVKVIVKRGRQKYSLGTFPTIQEADQAIQRYRNVLAAMPNQDDDLLCVKAQCGCPKPAPLPRQVAAIVPCTECGLPTRNHDAANHRWLTRIIDNDRFQWVRTGLEAMLLIAVVLAIYLALWAAIAPWEPGELEAIKQLKEQSR